MKKLILWVFLGLSCLALDAIDSPDLLNEFEQEYTAEVLDPFYAYNHLMHTINWTFYDYVLNPMLKTYNTIMPVGYRYGIYNFFNNLASPLRFLAHFLSFHPKEGMDELGRFMLNSSVGMLGFFDVASQYGLYMHRIDFGIMLGKWGVSSGPYLVLPLLGPRNIRDAITIPLNALANPIAYINPTALSFATAGFREFNNIAYNKEGLQSLRKGALGDDYILIRDSYLQYRNILIKGDS